VQAKRLSFSAKVHTLGINPCVDVPAEIADALLKQANKKNGPVPVRGRLRARPFTQTIVKFRGVWRLYLNGDMRRRAGVESGDRVEIELAFDPKPPQTRIPARLASALRADMRARAAFDALTPSRRKEIIAYLDYLKTDEALERNVNKVLGQLKTLPTDKPR
jgi:hypothetical protein